MYIIEQDRISQVNNFDELLLLKKIMLMMLAKVKIKVNNELNYIYKNSWNNEKPCGSSHLLLKNL